MTAGDVLTLVATGSGTIPLLIVVFIQLFGMIYAAKRYKRCPANRILVKYGRVGEGGITSKCFHGGGTIVWPLIQDFQYMSLKPMSVTLNFKEILPSQALTFDLPQNYHFAISTDPSLMPRAAERLLGMKEHDITELVHQILSTQLRIIATRLDVAQLNQNPEAFLNEFHSVCKNKLNELGLELLDI